MLVCNTSVQQPSTTPRHRWTADSDDEATADSLNTLMCKQRSVSLNCLTTACGSMQLCQQSELQISMPLHYLQPLHTQDGDPGCWVQHGQVHRWQRCVDRALPMQRHQPPYQ